MLCGGKSNAAPAVSILPVPRQKTAVRVDYVLGDAEANESKVESAIRLFCMTGR